jgi:hypothetical protein
MKTISRVVVSIVGGVVITLATGLFSSTPGMLVGAEWYGFPLAWLIRMIVAPEYNPWKVEYVNFIADVVVWSVILFVIIFIVDKVRRPASK